MEGARTINFTVTIGEAEVRETRLEFSDVCNPEGAVAVTLIVPWKP